MLTKDQVQDIKENGKRYEYKVEGKFPYIVVDAKKVKICIGKDYSFIFDKENGDFKRWVLLPAIKAVNEHTDLNVSFNEIKTGRSVTAIAFKVKSDATKEAAKANRRHVNVIVVRQVAPPDDVKVPKLSAKQQKANAEAALAAAGYYSKKDADPIPF